MKPSQATTTRRLPSRALTVLAAAAAAAAAVALGGCASPYVTLEKRAELDANRPVTLPTAISDARNVQSQYRAKVVELGEAERALSNSLLSLGTLIVGLGVAEVHSSTVRGAVLGTGAVYTIGTANTDKRRAQIYIAGMKALDCAVDAVTPLMLSDDLATKLKKDVEVVDATVKELGAAVGLAEGWAMQARLTDANKFQPALDATALALVAAQTAINQADSATDLAMQRLNKPQQIARDLNNAVSGIDRAVLDEIRGTENAVQAVPAILASLQSNAALFSLQSLAPNLVPQPATTTPTDEKGAGFSKNSSRRAGPAAANVAERDRLTLDGLERALGNLRGWTVVLASRADRLSKAAAATPSQTVSDAVKACEVKGTVKAIVATPTSVTFVAKKASRQSIMVDGGNGNFTVAFLQAPVPGLTASIPPRAKGVVEIAATDQTVAGGSYQLIIEDTTLTSRQIVSVAIAAAPAAASPAQPSKPDLAAQSIEKASPLDVGGTKVKVTAVAQGDGVKVTYTTDVAAVTDDKVREAVKGIEGVTDLVGQEDSLFVVSKVKSVDKAGGVLKNKPKAPDGGPVVAALDVTERRRIQARLCMPNDKIKDTWSDEAQLALRKDRTLRPKGTPVPGPTEMLTLDEKVALLALDDAKAAARCKRP